MGLPAEDVEKQIQTPFDNVDPSIGSAPRFSGESENVRPDERSDDRRIPFAEHPVAQGERRHDQSSSAVIAAYADSSSAGSGPSRREGTPIRSSTTKRRSPARDFLSRFMASSSLGHCRPR